MEVHRHSHLASGETHTSNPDKHRGRKKWTHYFWEFLMLFLAVFCGFLAEYKLEQTIERHREKEFILSIIEDAITDTANIHAAIPLNIQRAAYADSLAIACVNYGGTQKETSDIYKFHRNCVYRPDLVYPTDRTLFQLKNSGGMRLIRNKKATDIINAYDNAGKKVVTQQDYYETYLTEVTNFSFELINFVQFWKLPRREMHAYDTVKLINVDRLKLIGLGNRSIVFRGIMLQYNNRLKELENISVTLINTLKKEYKLN